MKHRVIDPAGAFFGLVVPIGCAVASLTLTKHWQPRLPDKIATHWTASTPDGFSTPTAAAWTVVLLTVLLGAGLSAIAALAPAQLIMRRFMLITGLVVTGLITAVNYALLHSQLDGVDPAQTSLPLWSLGPGTAIGFVVGLLGASTLRNYRVRTPATTAPADDLPRCDVALPIIENVGFSTRGSAILSACFLAPGLLLSLMMSSVWPLLMFAIITLLAVSLTRFRVVVDESRIRIFNSGLAAMSYDIDEVVDAKVTTIKPFDDFGGWGLKAKGRRNYGIVTRTGPAVVITFAGGDRLTITAAQAEDIAGSVNRLSDARSDSGLR